MLAAVRALAVAAACGHVRGLHVQDSIQAGPAPGGGWEPLETGRPYDFDDFRRDKASAQAVRAVVAARGKAEGTAASRPHFFSEADCSIFKSAADCARARENVTYLATFPGSGNTWVRSLLEQTLLIYTGSVFDDSSLRAAGMFGEGIPGGGPWQPDTVFPVKTHWPVLGAHTTGPAVRNLAIVREPLQAALSWTNFKHGGHDHLKEISHAASSKHFKKFARTALKHWALMASTYRARDDVYVVRYEDLVANTTDVMLTQVLPYLGVDGSHPDVRARLDAALDRTSTANYTTHRKHTYTFEFTPEHRALVTRLIGAGLAGYYGYRI